MKRRYIGSMILLTLGLAILASVGRAQVSPYAYKWRDYEAKQKILWIGGGDYHDTLICAAALRPMIEETGKYHVVYSEDYNSLKQLDGYAAVVYAAMVRELTPEQENSLTAAVKNGTPLVGLHGATASFKQPKAFQDPTLFDRHTQFFTMFGGEFIKHPPLQEFKVKVTDRTHPIMKGVGDFSVVDEMYTHVHLQDGIHVLLEAQLGEATAPVAWVTHYGKGRVFYVALGHDDRTVSLEPYRKMVMQGLGWALGQ